MAYFSGFSLKGEAHLFAPFIEESDFCISGFSLGAIEAVEYAFNTTTRIDKLQLFSPAFFMDKDEKFKRLQLLYFQKDPKAYCKNFLKNIAYPSSYDMRLFYHDSSKEALERLLYYQWSKERLEALQKRAIMIEVYLGGKDKIIDAQKAKAFFQPFATIYWVKDAGHILKERNG